jgi:hypothetical protein
MRVITKEITIEQLRNAIKKLPPYPSMVPPGAWYKTEQEHWLGWLKFYRGPGVYGRKGGENREARFVYNHIVEYRMLLWIIEAAGIEPGLVGKAKSVIDGKKTLQANASTVRKIVPWDILAAKLWKKGK